MLQTPTTWNPPSVYPHLSKGCVEDQRALVISPNEKWRTCYSEFEIVGTVVSLDTLLHNAEGMHLARAES